jgi:hypothetical protein
MSRFPKPWHLQSTMATIGLSMNKGASSVDLLCKNYWILISSLKIQWNQNVLGQLGHALNIVGNVLMINRRY